MKKEKELREGDCLVRVGVAENIWNRQIISRRVLARSLLRNYGFCTGPTFICRARAMQRQTRDYGESLHLHPHQMIAWIRVGGASERSPPDSLTSAQIHVHISATATERLRRRRVHVAYLCGQTRVVSHALRQTFGANTRPSECEQCGQQCVACVRRRRSENERVRHMSSAV